MSRRTPVVPAAALLAASLLALAPPLPAQVAELPGVPPAVRAALLLRQADGVKRVLVIGAHPDDEDTSLLTALSRGAGARTAYLSLTRGEGGQNLVGPELDEGLGLLRTGELLAARELDGAEQYFTRAYDFGYSKTAEETFSHWPREALVEDVVRVIRMFRPQVVVSIFSGTPSDGHGQHQVAGMVTREAFDAAADPERFPALLADGLEPWAPSRLYLSTRFSPGDATLSVPTGALDPLLGASAHQVAMASRSRHRSQDMGRPQEPGPRRTSLRLVRSRGDGPAAGSVRRSAGGSARASAGRDAPGEGLFSGVDTTLAALADRAPLREALASYRERVREAEDALVATRPGAAVPALVRALAEVRRAGELAAEGGSAADVSRVIAHRERLVTEALLAAAGVRTEVRVEPGLLVPGGEARARVLLWNGGAGTLVEPEPVLDLPPGWAAVPAGTRRIDPDTPPDPVPPWEEEGAETAGPEADGGIVRVPPGSLAEWRFRIRVPPDAGLSEPYFLRAERAGDLYRWPGAGAGVDAAPPAALPRNPPPVRGGARFGLLPPVPDSGAAGPDSTAPVRLSASVPAVHVAVDKAAGEYRERVLVVPALSVALSPEVLAWPLADREPREATVQVRSPAPGPLSGVVRLETPPGWAAEPSEVAFTLEGAGASRRIPFRLHRIGDERPGYHALRAVAEVPGRGTFDREVALVSYPHVERDLLLRPAATRISLFDVEVEPGLRVGYVMGSGDEGPEALRRMGVAVRMLGPEEVEAGAYGGLDAVVLGVRAYETRPDLAATNDALLEYARAGGTVIVQYNKYEYPQGGFAPYPLDIDRPHDRVTDETAPVTLLDPASPLLASPNRIGPADFEGWVQERGLYFAGTWDERYTPLLEMADPGEEPKRGALLVAPVGEGVYVYTGLALFRQLPEGVPGAYRLLANLVSLDAQAWRAHHGGGGGQGGGAREGDTREGGARGGDARGGLER